ncbi:MAG: argininosuccinate lyase [Bacteroidales bacterium]|nr:MAG: argininosuccinate lyase [Bacteroidales bacterium]
MKLWDKGKDTNKFVENYTIGNDNKMDMYLAESDVIGTLAHIKMLCKVGLLKEDELSQLHHELVVIYKSIEQSNFSIESGIEDVHSQIEYLLTIKLGEIGKKVHSGRSRNDQVLVDIRLFTRDSLIEIISEINLLFQLLIEQSEKNKDVLMPGYTHLQVAMPSSFGLWFGAYAEALADDLNLILSSYQINNQNPLGSAAGYGSSFPLDRTLTTKLLGFDDLDYNVVYAQMGRGKVEKIVAFVLANFASTIGKMSADICLFMSQNFGFIGLPDELTTGSSIMPHKKNPDIFEITRGKCNRLQALPVEIGYITGNLTSGYFRDYQLIKESYLPIFDVVVDIIKAARLGVKNLIINKDILSDSKYDYLFTVEKVNELVLQGIPFREAYKLVGNEVETGTFIPNKNINHTHEGSIVNLCNKEIENKFNAVLNKFNVEKVITAKEKLLQDS